MITRREALQALWLDLEKCYDTNDLSRMEELELHVMMFFMTCQTLISKIKAKQNNHKP